MTLEVKLNRAIKRSEKAYTLYLDKRYFFQALRIYKANIVIYELLEEFIFICEEEFLEPVFEYLFHLEDWFESFNAAQKKKPPLTHGFVFEDLPESLKYPSNFINHVLNKQK